MNSGEKINFLVSIDEKPTNKSAMPLPSVGELSQKLVAVSLSGLESQLQSTLGHFIKILGSLPSAPTGYVVEEVKLSLTMNSSGELSIVSVAKGTLGGSGTIDVTIKRAK